MENIQEYINEAVENGVFEIWYPGIEENSRYTGSIYIPYMMNDAMECYIELTNAVLVGEYIRELMDKTTVMFHNEDKKSLIIRQGDENTCTLWYEEAVLEKKYYRFDGICHMWEQGQEQWSQLVYMIGTMFDKYAFNGSKSCNNEEIELMNLVEFAPFRNLAPAKQLFEDLYEDTKRGAKLMSSLSFKAKDVGYGVLCLIYGIIPFRYFTNFLTSLLKKKSRYRLYEYIYNKTNEAASKYEDRNYANGLNDVIKKKRNEVDLLLKNKGFVGNYPEYSKENIFVSVVEERPFTIMDWEEIVFDQKLMVSIIEEKIWKKRRKHCRNLGFFEGRGLKNRIVNPEELDEIN